MLNILVKFLLK